MQNLMIFKRKQTILKIIEEIKKYKMEFVNAKLEDRKNGWDILVELKKRINKLK